MGCIDKRKAVLVIIAVLAAMVLNQCGKEDSYYKVESVDNTKLIHSYKPLWQDTQKIELKLIAQIGGNIPEKEEYAFYRNYDMVQDKNNNKYILSWGRSFVRKFDKDWNFLLGFGNEGQGPGEIEWPMHLGRDPEGNIYIVSSFRGRKAVKYSPDGDYLDNIKLPGNCRNMIVLHSGDYVLDITDPGAEASPDIMALVSSDGGIKKRFCSAKDFEDSFLTKSVNQVYFTHDDADNIYVAFRNQNRIDKYSSEGHLIWRAKQNIDYPIINKMTLQEDEMWPDLTYIHTDIAVDSKQRLWVTTFKSLPEKKGSQSQILENPDNLEFRIFNEDGIWLGRIPVPVSHYKKRIYGDHLYLMDPYSKACVYEYEIVEKEHKDFMN